MNGRYSRINRKIESWLYESYLSRESVKTYIFELYTTTNALIAVPADLKFLTTNK